MSAVDYTRYYESQLGGSVPVFRGGQHGAGIGDILRSIFRFLAPVAVRGISSFASSMLNAHQKGTPLGDAAKGAVMPAVGAMLSAAKQQTGGSASALFSGKEGIPYNTIDHQPAYKRRGKKRPKKAAKKSNAKRRRQEALNF